MIIRDEKGRVSFGQWDYVIQVLIILSLIAFAIETLPDLSDSWKKGLRVLKSGPSQSSQLNTFFGWFYAGRVSPMGSPFLGL